MGRPCNVGRDEHALELVVSAQLADGLQEDNALLALPALDEEARSCSSSASRCLAPLVSE